MTANMASPWRSDGTLHLVHRGVHAFGHRSIPIEGRLVAALLYVGDGAVLSHATAAWWWGLLAAEPETIEVSTSSWSRSCPGVLVHHRREVRGTRHRRFPITTIGQTLLDYAASADLLALRRVPAEADYRRLLDPAAVQALLGQGRPGTAKLRQALKRHEPRLARTRSWRELVFIPVCERFGIELPEVNVRLHNWTVDALWRRHAAGGAR